MIDKEPGMDCIIVGGCANGTLLKDIRVDAEVIELSRPVGLKPLASAIQQIPEIVNESDRYDIHPIALSSTKNTATVVAMGVVKGRSLNWGFSQLVIGYVQNVTSEMIAAGVITKQ